jgi:hypothetical protein
LKRAALESHLRRNFATLTVGSLISFSFPSHPEQKYEFLVGSLKPETREKACVIVDADVEVDIVPMDESIAFEAMKKKAGGTLQTQQLQSTNQGQDVKRINELDWKVQDDKATSVLTSRATGTISRDQFAYFRIRTKHNFYSVELDPVHGDAG